ncbi:MAG: 3-keto-5-aminohexanoate cleavage protein [Rhizobiales bacterium]|nr:3-keto-5-aminohexanoate cleavage protein [Hyphomicrobiales bacterium]
MNDLAIMVAPNGARKGLADHPNLPILPEAIAREAAACVAQGARAIHLHVRDDAGKHTLDAARYLATTDAIKRAVGSDVIVQITTEAVGIFSPTEQIAVVHATVPEAVSIATKELIPDASAENVAADLYRWAYARRIAVQHIVYSVEELDRLLGLIARGIIPGHRHSLIFPLGRYVTNQESDPAELVPFVAKLKEQGSSSTFIWWACAFGTAETTSLVAAAALGGHCRIGFENSFLNADGSLAASNAERVADLQASLRGVRRAPSSRAEALIALGKPG